MRSFLAPTPLFLPPLHFKQLCSDFGSDNFRDGSLLCPSGAVFHFMQMCPDFGSNNFRDGFLLYPSGAVCNLSGTHPSFFLRRTRKMPSAPWGAFASSLSLFPGGVPFVSAPLRMGQVLKVYEYSFDGKGFCLPSSRIKMRFSIGGVSAFQVNNGRGRRDPVFGVAT